MMRFLNQGVGMKKAAKYSLPFTDFNPNNIAFGERIKVARKFVGFKTGKAFAEKLGVNYLTYNNYERGRNGLKDAKLLNKICAVTGVSNTWLKTGKGQPVDGDPVTNEKFCAMLKPTTVPIQSALNEELLVSIFDELSQLKKAKGMAETVKLRLAIKAYKYMMDLDSNLSDAVPQQVMKGAVSLVVDVVV